MVAPAAFVAGYLGASGGSPFLPRDRVELEVQFETLLLEKTLEELLYDLSVRPELSFIPLRSLNYMLTAHDPP